MAVGGDDADEAGLVHDEEATAAVGRFGEVYGRGEAFGDEVGAGGEGVADGAAAVIGVGHVAGAEHGCRDDEGQEQG